MKRSISCLIFTLLLFLIGCAGMEVAMEHSKVEEVKVMQKLGKIFVGLFLLSLIVGCGGVHIPPLTRVDISIPNKTIFIMPAYDLSDAHIPKDAKKVTISDRKLLEVYKHTKEITFKLQDYFKQTGWTVLFYHQVITPEVSRELLKTYGMLQKKRKA